MPFILIFLYFTLNYLGFCFEKCKFLSDEEKINVAIKVVMGDRHSIKREDGADYIVPAYNMPYLKTEENSKGIYYSRDEEDMKNFKLENPNCCSLSKYLYTTEVRGNRNDISFRTRIRGLVSDIITVKFKYKDINGEEKEGSRLIPISNCGKYGLSLNYALVH
jgi:hypothetical protein